MPRGRKKSSDPHVEIRQLVIEECPDFSSNKKCIWGYVCKHFAEIPEPCSHFDKFVPLYKEQKAKYKEQQLKRRYKAKSQ